ncbi:MAG: hypothetical protein QG604_486 [Candidatus Dependentiae bacterium]|nr:hypothetical protein [Candidatus Dependentiae bacterium]
MNIISTLTLLCMVPSFVSMGADTDHAAPKLTKGQELFSKGKAQWMLGLKMDGVANIHGASLYETAEEAAKSGSAARWLKDHEAEIMTAWETTQTPTNPAPTAPIKTNCCWKAVFCCCSCLKQRQ